MNRLDPDILFRRIIADVPEHLRKHLFVIGSLAAAYHFQTKMKGRGVNTKDADLVIHPAGDVESCRNAAMTLLGLGWMRTDDCYPTAAAEPLGQLRAIRLYPPGPRDYFIEFLSLPQQGQQEPKQWLPVLLDDGWYGLPSFRFLGVTSLNRLTSSVGLEYASPSMMALANLLAHPRIGMDRIESGAMQGLLRSAKDLGRVVALARLAGREETEVWLEPWKLALKTCFPGEWREMAAHAGDGLRDLLEDRNALEDARKSTDVGLLNGMNVTSEMLKATGERLVWDVIAPLGDATKVER